MEKSLLVNDKKLMKEWNYSKNADLDPKKLIIGSGKKAWWKCSKCGHSWKTAVYSRITGTGCPLCANQKNGKYNAKKVIQLTKEGTIIKEYNSIKEAERETGAKNIFYVCSGKRKTSGGFLWKNKDEI